LNGSNQVTTRRLYLDAVDAVFARIGGTGTVDWYLTDHLGSIRGLMNNSGTLDDTLTWDAWGNLVSESTPANGDRYAWTGRERDVETGLQYNRARWYDPATGRWMSQDPLGFDAGDSNLYRYVNNEPTNYSDPIGRQEQVGILSIGKLTSIKEGLENGKLPTQLEIKYMVVTFGLDQGNLFSTGKEMKLIEQIFRNHPTMDKALLSTIQRDLKTIDLASRPAKEVADLQGLLSKLHNPVFNIRNNAEKELKRRYDTSFEGQLLIRTVLQDSLKKIANEEQRRRIVATLAWCDKQTFYLGPEGENQDIRGLYRAFVKEIYTSFGASVYDFLFELDGMPKNLEQRGKRILQAMDRIEKGM
jgi:RHS repeat-associated protein